MGTYSNIHPSIQSPRPSNIPLYLDLSSLLSFFCLRENQCQRLSCANKWGTTGEEVEAQVSFAEPSGRIKLFCNIRRENVAPPSTARLLGASILRWLCSSPSCNTGFLNLTMTKSKSLLGDVIVTFKRKQQFEKQTVTGLYISIRPQETYQKQNFRMKN